MAHAETCPVCNGKGYIIIEGNWQKESKKEKCHGCWGIGWVTVQDNSNIYWPKIEGKHAKW